MVKESEVNKLSASLNDSGISQLLACHQAVLSVQSEAAMNQTMDPTNLKEVAKMTKKEEIDLM